jgi:hypothetical protein
MLFKYNFQEVATLPMLINWQCDKTLNTLDWLVCNKLLKKFMVWKPSYTHGLNYQHEGGS